MFKNLFASAAIAFAFASVGNATPVHHKSAEVDALDNFTISAGQVVKSYYDGYQSVTYRFDTSHHWASHGAGLIFNSDTKYGFDLGDYAGSWKVWLFDRTDIVKITFDETFKGWLTFKGFLGKTHVSVVDHALAPVEAPAPVPLPAAGLLLPIGLGALAFLRKRRNKAAI